jgi:hypothetical protein
VDTLLSRRSIRNYEKTDIPKEVLDQILEAGRMAPSAANKQPWHFIVVTDEELKRELSKGLFSRFIKDAPVTIVGCAHKDRFAGRWSIISTTIALQNMVINIMSLLSFRWDIQQRFQDPKERSQLTRLRVSTSFQNKSLESWRVGIGRSVVVDDHF